MKIAGVYPTSLLDYPGHISTILFTQGCNFKCPYCHNSQLITFISDTENLLEQAKELIENRKNLIEAVVITGGEPLMQDFNELVDLIKWIKKQGLKIKLDTNGSRPIELKELIDLNLLDYVAMDIKLPLKSYPMLGGEARDLKDEIKTSINILLESNIDYEFRTTVVPGLHKERDIKNIAKAIEGADNYYIQNFKANENVYAPIWRNLKGFTPDELKKFKNIAEKYVKNVKIRD